MSTTRLSQSAVTVPFTRRTGQEIWESSWMDRPERSILLRLPRQRHPVWHPPLPVCMLPRVLVGLDEAGENKERGEIVFRHFLAR